ITLPSTLAQTSSPTDMEGSATQGSDVTITRSTPVSFETLSFWGGKRITTVKVSDLEPSSAPFSTIRIRAGQGSVVRDGRGRVLSDSNHLKKRFYLHAELTEEEPLRTIIAEIQQNQNLSPGRPGESTSTSQSFSHQGNGGGAGEEGVAPKAPVTEGMSDRIEQLKRKASENAKKDHL
ncbi:hypothetical protein BGZ98_005726, partial [Dissophora globulifera]